MLAQKLNLKQGMKVRVIGKPADVRQEPPPSSAQRREDRIAWVVYPKGGQRTALPAEEMILEG